MYLSERHISWVFELLGLFELLGTGALALFVSQFLGPHTHALDWYLFSLVLLVSLVVISLVVISLVVLCVCKSDVNVRHIKRGQPKATCTPPPCGARACQSCVRA